jgi:hypothetical protein
MNTNPNPDTITCPKCSGENRYLDEYCKFCNEPLKKEPIIKCPNCGNSTEFVEVLNGCCLEQRYVLKDKKWELENSEVNPNVPYDLSFECNKCQHDCTDQHSKWLELYLAQEEEKRRKNK